MLRLAVVALLSVAYVNGQLCPANGDVTDAGRKAAVDKHNEFRSLTAQGKAVNKDGSKLPAGKNMFKLTWDCQLEKEAQAVANKNAAENCEMEHREPNKYGENLAVEFDSWENWDQSKASYTDMALPAATQNWYSELKEFGYVGEIKDYQMTHDLGHWSAMIWGYTKRIGCAVAKCDSKYSEKESKAFLKPLTKSIVACEYWPAGNGKHGIYEVGSPCQQDSDCPKDATCSAAEGLCIEGGPNAKTQLPTHDFVLAFKKPKPDRSDPAVKAAIKGFHVKGDTVEYWGKTPCTTDDSCKVPNGLAGTCLEGKCFDTEWTRKGCWAC